MPRLFGFTLAVLALACCDPAPVQPGLCEVSTEEEAGESWQAWAQGGVTVRLPPSFRPVLEPERQYAHGGAQWRDGDNTVELIWGRWGPSSLEPSGGGQWCLAEIHDALVALVEVDGDERRLAAWYLTDLYTMEPMLQAVDGSGWDRDLLWRILRAQRPFEEPGPTEPIGRVEATGAGR